MSCVSRDSVPSRSSSLSKLSLANDKGVKRSSSLLEVLHDFFCVPQLKYFPLLVFVLRSAATTGKRDGCFIVSPPLAGEDRGGGTLTQLAAFIHAVPARQGL
jgi:hypothetical protein